MGAEIVVGNVFGHRVMIRPLRLATPFRRGLVQSIPFGGRSCLAKMLLLRLIFFGFHHVGSVWANVRSIRSHGVCAKSVV